MLAGEKILITGAAGRVAFPIARALARENEVYGLARFGDPANRARLEALGITCVQKDLSRDDFGDLPQDFGYVFHAGAVFGEEGEREWDGKSRGETGGGRGRVGRRDQHQEGRTEEIRRHLHGASPPERRGG